MHQSIAKHIQNHVNRKYERNTDLTRKLPGFKSILLELNWSLLWFFGTKETTIGENCKSFNE